MLVTHCMLRQEALMAKSVPPDHTSCDYSALSAAKWNR